MKMRSKMLLWFVPSCAAAAIGVACSDDPAPIGPSNDAGTGGDGSNTSSSGSAETGPTDQCPTSNAPVANANKNCTAQLGEPAVFRGNKCVKLKSEDCPTVLGSVDDDNTVIFGGIFDLSGSNALTGESRQRSAALAIDEINAATQALAAKGVPSPDPCAKGRPIAMVVCDNNTTAAPVPPSDAGAPDAAIADASSDAANADAASDASDASAVDAAPMDAGPADAGPPLPNLIDRKRGATHLIDDLQAGAIVLSAGSTGFIDVANNVTIPKKTVIFGGSSTSPDITNLPGATVEGTRIVWRAAPSDIAQAAAVNALVAEREAALKMANPAASVKLAIVWSDNAYGKGIADNMKSTLKLNGVALTDASNAANLFDRKYTTATGAQPAELAQIKTDLGAFNPDLIVVIGLAEASTIIDNHEKSGAATKAQYLLPDGPRRNPLPSVVGMNDDLRVRIRGVAPGVVSPLTKTFFDVRYKTKFPKASDGKDSVLSYGMAGTYDGVYLLSYALSTVSGNSPSGLQFAKGLEKTAEAQPAFSVGTADLNKVFSQMTSGKGFNVTGTSGPLDFDKALGEAKSDYVVWCMIRKPDGNADFYENTGQIYKTETSSLDGMFKCE
jgi:ABC-type branched-subunit amino acid transport system substrate-binding protein